MSSTERDERSPERRQLDEQIAGEPKLAPLVLSKDASCMPVEQHLRRVDNSEGEASEG